MTAQILPFVRPVTRIERDLAAIEDWRRSVEPRECPKIRELRKHTRQICEHFNWQFSGGEK